jgi:hypothetical protein
LRNQFSTQKVEQVKKVVTLLSYIEKVSDILEVLKQNGMQCLGSQEIVRFKKFYEEHKGQQENLRLEEVEDNLNKIKQYLSDLTPDDQIEFFSQVTNT